MTYPTRGPSVRQDMNRRTKRPPCTSHTLWKPHFPLPYRRCECSRYLWVRRGNKECSPSLCPHHDRMPHRLWAISLRIRTLQMCCHSRTKTEGKMCTLEEYPPFFGDLGTFARIIMQPHSIRKCLAFPRRKDSRIPFFPVLCNDCTETRSR